MARSAKATTTSRQPVAATTPKKKMGRPLGSKNRVTAGAKPKAPPAAKKPAARRIVAKVAPAPVKMNKAELEAQVVKLERALARAKAQNAELKAALKDTQTPTKSAPVAKATPAAAKTKTAKAMATPAKAGRKPRLAAAAMTPEPAPVAAAPKKRGRQPKVATGATAPEQMVETGKNAE